MKAASRAQSEPNTCSSSSLRRARVSCKQRRIPCKLYRLHMRDHSQDVTSQSCVTTRRTHHLVVQHQVVDGGEVVLTHNRFADVSMRSVQHLNQLRQMI